MLVCCPVTARQKIPSVLRIASNACANARNAAPIPNTRAISALQNLTSLRSLPRWVRNVVWLTLSSPKI